ncbi:MAG: polysaccharide deacetylase family protein [Armatimonadetes bacterium]|nr:polysaccharide deacetylase family protein [Armatimonadota bacterium]
MTGFKRIWSSRWTPAVLVAVAFGAYAVLRPKAMTRETFDLRGDLLVSGNPHLREVCLTFDDGPHRESMTKILDALRDANVRATFFVVGKVVEKEPALVRRMMQEGHEVGNHTYSHKRLTQMALESAKQEIRACASSVERATGAKMSLLRPPGMSYDRSVLDLARELGYVTVHWNVVAADYVPVAPDTIRARVMRQVKDGSVVLLHDSPDTAAALPLIIRDLRAKGFGFVTASQMLARLPRPVFVATNAYSVKPAVPKPETAPARLVRQKPPVRAKTDSGPRREGPDPTPRSPQDVPVWDGGPAGSPDRHEESFGPLS